MKRRLSLVLAGTLLATPTLANKDVKCVQQGLLNAGFNPNGIDGSIGNGTKSAFSQWLLSGSYKMLGDLTLNSATSICQAMTIEAGFAYGVYSANFGPGSWSSTESACLNIQHNGNSTTFTQGACKKEPIYSGDVKSRIVKDGIELTFDTTKATNGDLSATGQTFFSKAFGGKYVSGKLFFGDNSRNLGLKYSPFDKDD